MDTGGLSSSPPPPPPGKKPKWDTRSESSGSETPRPDSLEAVAATSGTASPSFPPLLLTPKRSKPKRRKYNPSYLAFGFTYTGRDSDPIPQCVICRETLANGCMKPSLLQRHFKTKHETLQNQTLEFFQMKERELKANKSEKSPSFSAVNERALEASFKASLKIAQSGKSFTIGEKLILPAVKDIVSSVLGESAAKQLDAVPLSNNTVSRRIAAMADNVKEQVLEKLKRSKFFALQFDESADVANFAQLMCFVRFEDRETVCEEFLFCEPMTAHTTSVDIFWLIDGFINTNNLDWSKCVGVCTDGARAMTGKHSGVVAKIRDVAPEAQFTHCSIHREHLVAKNLSPTLKTVLDEAVKVVNFIKSHGLRTRLFALLCDEMGNDHKKLLYHTEVRWLSRGNVLLRLFELRHEVQMFLVDLKDRCGLHGRFLDPLWLCRVAYLADIFSLLNNLSRSLQGTNITPFRVQDKVKAMKLKLQYAGTEAEKGGVPFFPLLQGFVQENELLLHPDVLDDIRNHCQNLVEDFTAYFTENLDSYDWIRDPFCDREALPEMLTNREKEQLIDLSCDTELKTICSKLPLSDFWIKVRRGYPELAERAIKFLLSFSTTYLCEQGFSALVFLKDKFRSRLQVDADLRLKLSQTQPDIKKMVSMMQPQPSH